MLSLLQEHIFISLAQYKYLTTGQLYKLGIARNKRSIANAVRQLKDKERKYVDSYANSFVPGVGRLPSFHFLTLKGKRLLEQSKVYRGSIKVHKGKKETLPRDYFHRRLTLDCHIACVQQATLQNIEVLAFDRYFDSVGDNRSTGSLQSKTKILLPQSHIIADATFLLKRQGVSRLFALELHNQDSVGEVIKQIYQHLAGIRESSLSMNYGIQKWHRLLSVFAKQQLMDEVIQEIQLEEMTPFVLFKTVEQVTQDFFKDWVDSRGEEYSLFSSNSVLSGRFGNNFW